MSFEANKARIGLERSKKDHQKQINCLLAEAESSLRREQDTEGIGTLARVVALEEDIRELDRQLAELSHEELVRNRERHEKTLKKINPKYKPLAERTDMQGKLIRIQPLPETLRPNDRVAEIYSRMKAKLAEEERELADRRKQQRIESQEVDQRLASL